MWICTWSNGYHILAIGAIFTIPVPIVIIGSFAYQRFISPYYHHIRFTVGELVARLENNLSGIGVIKVLPENMSLNVFSSLQIIIKKQISSYQDLTLYVPIIRMVIAFGLQGCCYWEVTGYYQVVLS